MRQIQLSRVSDKAFVVITGSIYMAVVTGTPGVLNFSKHFRCTTLSRRTRKCDLARPFRAFYGRLFDYTQWHSHVFTIGRAKARGEASERGQGAGGRGEILFNSCYQNYIFGTLMSLLGVGYCVVA